MIDLLNDLADADSWYEDFAVWSYASTAYWWQNQGAIVRVARNVEIGFRFSLDGLRIQAAWWYGGPEQIALFRAAIAAEDSGRTLEQLVSCLAADGHEILGDVMKRVPRGYPAGHPRAGLLRHRSLIAAREFESDTVRDVEPVYRACQRLRPLLGWLAEHTAASLGGKQLPVPLGDDFDGAVGHFDGGLVVNRVRGHRHAGGPFFRIGQAIVWHLLVIQVRKYRKVHQTQRSVAASGRLPARELVPDTGCHYQAPGA
ncbi:MAG TPA: DUF2461 family protein [Streptosporangiaceae bacterium]